MTIAFHFNADGRKSKPNAILNLEINGNAIA
jgi:hypothetical protein